MSFGHVAPFPSVDIPKPYIKMRKPTHPNELVQISRFLISTDAHILRGLLETENIDVLIVDELTSSYLPMYPAVLGGIKVFVPFKDFEQAKKITMKYFENIEAVTNLCPNCDSKEIENDITQYTSRTLLNLITAVLSNGFAFTGSPYHFKHCKECEYRW